jgi:hypothetical protein
MCPGSTGARQERVDSCAVLNGPQHRAQQQSVSPGTGVVTALDITPTRLAGETPPTGSEKSSWQMSWDEIAMVKGGGA